VSNLMLMAPKDENALPTGDAVGKASLWQIQRESTTDLPEVNYTKSGLGRRNRFRPDLFNVHLLQFRWGVSLNEYSIDGVSLEAKKFLSWLSRTLQFFTMRETIRMLFLVSRRQREMIGINLLIRRGTS